MRRTWVSFPCSGLASLSLKIHHVQVVCTTAVVRVRACTCTAVWYHVYCTWRECWVVHTVCRSALSDSLHRSELKSRFATLWMKLGVNRCCAVVVAKATKSYARGAKITFNIPIVCWSNTLVCKVPLWNHYDFRVGVHSVCINGEPSLKGAQRSAEKSTLNRR